MAPFQGESGALEQLQIAVKVSNVKSDIWHFATHISKVNVKGTPCKLIHQNVAAMSVT
jgi:hypothetical protein